jgi:tetratricopeptide (TPR) repeat protein
MKRYLALGLLALACFACTKRSTTVTSNNPQAIEYNQGGVKLMKEGDFDGALKLLKQAVILDPTYYSPHVNMVNLYVHLKDYENAVKTCEQMLLLEPGSAKIQMFIGNLYDYTHEPEKAMTRYQIALVMFEERIAAETTEADLVDRALLYRLMGEEARARAEMDRLFTEYPKNSVLPTVMPLSKDEYIKSLFE